MLAEATGEDRGELGDPHQILIAET